MIITATIGTMPTRRLRVKYKREGVSLVSTWVYAMDARAYARGYRDWKRYWVESFHATSYPPRGAVVGFYRLSLMRRV